jgi:Na+/H+-dicarboxylate symporters
MKLSLPARVLIGFVGGSVAGAAAFWWTQHGGEAGVISVIVDSITQPAGQLFLKFLKMLVLPLMFSALVVGVTEIGDIASLGRIGWRMLFYTALLTSIAIGVGLIVINLVQPGVGFDPAIRDSLLAANTQARMKSRDQAVTVRRADHHGHRAGQSDQGGGERRFPRRDVLRR